MKQKYRSMTLRTGDNLDHDTAVVKALLFLNKYKKDKTWFVHMNHPVDYPDWFIEKHKLRRGNRDHFSHTFDGVIMDKHFKPIAFIEMNGEIGYWFQGKASKRVYTIANPTKHSKTQQKINDGINKSYAEYEGAEYIVLLKEEVNGDAKDPDKEKNSIQYLQRELRDWIK